MQSWSELGLLLRILEVDQAGEEQDHIATLVHDGAVAIVAADLAGKLVLDGLVGGIVPGRFV